jgi:hypothetical protein
VVQIIEASREKPYLGFRLKFDQHELSKLMVDSHLPPPRTQQSCRGMATGEVSLPLLNAVQRLIDPLAEEQDIPILAPVIQREILYRLLVSDQGARLRQIAPRPEARVSRSPGQSIGCRRTSTSRCASMPLQRRPA